MGRSQRTCLFLLTLILNVNARNNNGCSSQKHLRVAPTNSQDGRTITFDLHKASFVSKINIRPCPEGGALDNKSFTVKYVDPSDFTDQERLYSNELQGAFTDHDGLFSIMFNPHLYARRLSFSHQHVISCPGSIVLIGCDHNDVCGHHFCKNGGTCIGNGQCACTAGYMGPTCDMFAQDMTFDDYGFVTDLSGTLYTTAAAFNVSGDISFSYDDNIDGDGDAVDSRRSLGQTRTFAHLFGSGGSLNLLSSHMASFQHNLHNTIGHSASHNVYSALHNFAKGFSHTVQAIFGHGHHHGNTHYFYTTHGTSHYSHGSSLHYTNHHLHMHVHFVNNVGHHHHFHTSSSFIPTPGQKYTIVSSFSPHFGISVYVNGKKYGSLTLPNVIKNALNHFGLPRPLCFGLCGAHNGYGPFSLSVGNIAVAGASLGTMAVNSLLGLLGLPMLNLLAPSHHTKVSAYPTSVVPMTTTTASKGRFTPAPTTLPAATATTANVITTTPPGLLCYACANMNGMGVCSTTSQCYSGEVCTVFSGSHGFDSRCMSKQLCDAKKKAATGCWKCCTSNLCNDQCVAAPTCQDSSRCALLRSIGYNVCNDPVASVTLCPKFCNKCPGTG